MEQIEGERIGEIIEADTGGFTAQCYELFDLPALGSLVRCGDGDGYLYGIVRQAMTSAIDPGRKPVARGRDVSRPEDIYIDNPQLARLLKSEFAVLVVGFRQGDEIRQYLPPRPARVHGFVYRCPPDEAAAFSGRLGFLSLLLSSEDGVPGEELTAAALRQLACTHPDPEHFLLDAGRELAQLLGRDYARLKIILERIRP